MNIHGFEFSISETSFRAGHRPVLKYTINKKSGRQSHGILFLFSGAVEFYDSEHRGIMRAEKGDLVYIPKGEKYELAYVAETHFSLLNFDAHLCDGADATFSDGIEILLKNTGDADIEKVFLEAERHAAAEGAATAFWRKELIYRLFALLSREITGVDRRIADGVKLLEERFLENVPISEIAEASFISESNFRKIFLKRFGTSPVQYRNSLRLKRAQTLLSDGEYSVSEVAGLSGFPSESYFCRAYKKAFGVTPKLRKGQ